MSYSREDVQRWLKQPGSEDFARRNSALQAELGEQNKARELKYHNHPTASLEGERFDSGKEAEDARNFTLAVRAGEYILYRHHVMIKLPSGNRLELDHVVIDNQMRVRIFDTKAQDKKTGKFLITREWKNKAKEFKAAYGFEIQII